MSSRLLAYLGLNKHVGFSQVLAQLQHLQKNEREAMASSYQLTKKSCVAIYQFLQVGMGTVNAGGSVCHDSSVGE